MEWWHSRYWYIPIALVITTGYGLGGFFWFKYGFPVDGNPPHVVELEYFITLFSLGIVGGSMHCSVFFSNDANKKMYGAERLPTVFDPFGYTLQIIGGGFTGVMLYLAFKAGLVVMLSGDSDAELSRYAAWLIALSGGFGTHHVKQFISRFVAGATKKEKRGEESKASDDSYKGKNKDKGTSTNGKTTE